MRVFLRWFFDRYRVRCREAGVLYDLRWKDLQDRAEWEDGLRRTQIRLDQAKRRKRKVNDGKTHCHDRASGEL